MAMTMDNDFVTDEGDLDPPKTIHDLPEEIMEKIFDYLTIREKVQIELVCKEWQRLSRSSWRSITDLSLGYFPRVAARSDLFSELLQRLRVVSKLSLDHRFVANLQFDDDEVFRAIGDHCPNLKSLNISSLQKCTTTSTSDANHNLCNIAKCEQLRELSVSHAFSLTDEDVTRFVQRSASHLTRLKIMFNDKITGKFLRHANDNVTLVNICFRACLSLKDEAIAIIAEKWPYLEELEIAINSSFTSAGLDPIGKLKYLRVLRLSVVNQLVDVNAFGSLILRDKIYLRELDLSRNVNLKDRHLIDILALLPSLELLDITNNKRVTDSFCDQWFAHEDRVVGQRWRDAPLKLHCWGSGIASEKIWQIPFWKIIH